MCGLGSDDSCQYRVTLRDFILSESKDSDPVGFLRRYKFCGTLKIEQSIGDLINARYRRQYRRADRHRIPSGATNRAPRIPSRYAVAGLSSGKAIAARA